MKKNKEKVRLFEKVEISDNEVARTLYEKETKSFTFKLICTVASFISTLTFILFTTVLSGLAEIPVIEGISVVLYVAGLILTILSGPLKIIKLFFKVGKVCYFIVPIVLFDVIAFVIGLCLALIALVTIPVVFATYNLYFSYQTKKEAELFLSISHPSENSQF